MNGTKPSDKESLIGNFLSPQNSDPYGKLPDGESLTDFKTRTLGTVEDVEISFQALKQYKNSGQGEVLETMIPG